MGHRIGLISNVPPVVVPLVAALRELEHEPVGWLRSGGRTPMSGRFRRGETSRIGTRRRA